MPPKKPVTAKQARAAVELVRLRRRAEEAEAREKELMAENTALRAEGERRHQEVMQRLEALINTFSFHNNAMVAGLNAQTAVIANLKVGK